MSRDELRMENLRMLPQLKSLKTLIDSAILLIENDILQVGDIDMMVAYAKRAVA